MLRRYDSADHQTKLRGPDGAFGGTLRQSDYAHELRTIWDVQGLPEDLFVAVVRIVFEAETPKGSAESRVGRDPLPGQRGLPRATKSHSEFQRHRIAAICANLRIRESGTSQTRPLSGDELRQCVDYLWNTKTAEEPSWSDVASVLGVERSRLYGTATPTEDGDRASLRPPLNQTDRIMRTTKVRVIQRFWQDASSDQRIALIRALDNASTLDESRPAAADVVEFLSTLSDEDQTRLDDIKLPPGRAAYSVESLRRLTDRMLADGIDLHAARVAEFAITPDWKPPADPINTPLGHPSVDRVLKIVGRWLDAVESIWGAPDSVNIEHVRDGFMSRAKAHELDQEMNRRHSRNRELDARILAESWSSGSHVSREDRIRFEAITRQNCVCIYCGGEITFSSCQMDHIVPRAGVGSNNRRENLVACCAGCNLAKSNTPFGVWANTTSRPGVSVNEAVERTKFWNRDPGIGAAAHQAYVREVVSRLKRTEQDPELDGRSMESVAWMANELHHRIQARFGANTDVQVFRGTCTSEARRASGIERRVQYLNGAGKTRLDRRHHAVDAAVIALMRPSIAQTLAERLEIRNDERMRRASETWREYQGRDVGSRLLFHEWRHNMSLLADLLNEALTADAIPVTRALRLRLGNSKAHSDSVRKLTRMRVGDEISVKQIDRAASPGLWCALTRHPDFVPGTGLPASSSREVRVHGSRLKPSDSIEFLSGSAAGMSVRGGYVDIGTSIHHVRVFVIEGKKPTFAMIRVFATDLSRHRTDDLFAVPLRPESMSMRVADPRLREALAHSKATQLGWLVVGDEMEIRMDEMTGDVKHVVDSHGQFVRRWVVEGFSEPTRIGLRPSLLAAEGLDDTSPPSHRTIIDTKGWRPSVNVLFSTGAARVIRRDVLGRERSHSQRGLPVGWAP